jgi:FkbM family methyltransferase
VEGHLRATLHAADINVVLDVGAHTGDYARLLRRSGYKGHIVSFEPVASSFADAKRDSESDNRWQVHRLALGDRSERARIRVAKQSTLSSLLPQSEYGERAFAGGLAEQHEDVEVRRLDEVWDSVLAHVTEPRVFLKLDTQGYDLKVLEGAEEHLGEIHGLQVELSLKAIYKGSPPLAEALERIDGLGFAVTGLYPAARDGPLLVEVDCIAIRL